MKKCLVFLIISFLIISCSEKEIKITPISANTYKSSMRGLFSVDDKITWASGTDGVIMKTIDNKNWTSYQDTSLSHLDFRDIHAFNVNEAIIMSSGDGCEIYRTNNGGENWTKVYENKQAGIFFDGMDFWDNKNGIAFSDPIDGKLYLIETSDGGKSWKQLIPEQIPDVLDGEAGFAASGTGINCLGENTVVIGTGGGAISRVFKSFDRGLNWEVVNTTMRNGEASGIYSLTFLDDKNGVAVGGNYLDSASINGNCAITSDGGLSWHLPQTPPTGYMSCVVYNSSGILISTGRNGTDVSFDKGNNWKHMSEDAYYSCVLNESSGWLTGRSGKLAKISIE